MISSIDLFCGAGGLTLGLQKNGIDCKIAVECEKDFADTFKLNNKNAITITEDISKVCFLRLLKNSKLKKIDLLCGGPPCQGFSTVGKKNEKDERNSLFWQFLRAVDEVNPRIVLFENVSGFKKLYSGAAYHTLVSELENKGYKVQSEIPQIKQILTDLDEIMPQIKNSFNMLNNFCNSIEYKHLCGIGETIKE